MNLFCVGISHHTANVATRERFAREPAAAAALRTASGCEELLLLTTCNRVEIYAAATSPISTQAIAECLSREVADRDLAGTSAFYRYEADECIRHLFRVVSGLDSMVVGETEILGQTKRAYALAREEGRAGPYLHRLFQRAFRVAKQVRTHTQITRGAVSVGSVAVDLAGKIFGALHDRKVLVLGAGETSERTARALVSRGVGDLRIANRSEERAADLTGLVGGRVIAFAGWESQCREIDILITSTAADAPILTRDGLEPMLRDRLDRPLFIIDIAVPRDVAPDVNEMEGVYLYDIDSLQSIAEQSLTLRKQQIAAGDKIIAEHAMDFAARFLPRTANQPASNFSAPAAVTEAPLRASES
jgi:glutamyl-tRNA reductase